MRVLVHETVEVEATVDVSIDDLLAELWGRLDSVKAGEELPEAKVLLRRACPIIDCATKILASIPDQAIAVLPESAAVQVRKRLETELQRYSEFGR